MTVWKIPHYKAFVEKEDVTQVSKIIKRGMFWALGPEIDEFEKSLAKFVGSKYCVSFNSGTSALHASLLSLNLKPKIVSKVESKPKIESKIESNSNSNNLNKENEKKVPFDVFELRSKINNLKKIDIDLEKKPMNLFQWQMKQRKKMHL